MFDVIPNYILDSIRENKNDRVSNHVYLNITFVTYMLHDLATFKK